MNGLDTIQELIGVLPKRISLQRKLEVGQQTLQQAWNACYVAIVPYCIKCKAPLIWHTHPDGEVLFHCPTCNTQWIKGEGWEGKQLSGEKV